MAVFLNTAKLNEWIPRLIQETEKELLIIVPYIKTSEQMYNYLFEANKKGIETTLVYRENKLPTREKAKFQALDNLNLMHHPNVHCKCYFNEKYLIISSMNLYEYSEKNNREMGILLHRKSFGTVDWGGDDQTLFKDAVLEVGEILNGATIEKKSRETIEEGFEMAIIKTERQKAEEMCKTLCKAFVHKRFEPAEVHGTWYSTCENYFDKVDVNITNRAEVQLKMDQSKVDKIYNHFTGNYNEFRFQGFKVYWNQPNYPIYLYTDGREKKWESLTPENGRYEVIRDGIDKLIEYLRTYF